MKAGLGLSDFLAAISSGRDGMPVNIDEAQQITGLSREAVLKRFRQLQDEGEGYLRLGRHGHPTRFYFRSQPKADRPPPEPDRSAPVESEAAEGLVRHSYQLRQGLCIAVDLPADLTEREAARLARFIETLPL